jgi:hypothetical protein
MHSETEKYAQALQGALAGAVKGSACGALASLATGAAIITTAPAWLPWLGGASAVALGKVAAWSAAGACIGAVAGGSLSSWKHQQAANAFAEAFPDLFKAQGGRHA